MSAARQGRSLDDFMNHSNRGGGGAYLSGWKKKDGRIVVWLHTKLWSAPCWNHPLPHVAERKGDGDQEELRVTTNRWVCHEEEEVLKRQYFREDSGQREQPPALCPYCLYVEAIFDLVQQGKINWLSPILRWDGEGQDDELVILAGGAYNAFRSKNLTKEQLQQMKRARVRRDEAWRQDLRARLQYLFCVVDDAAVDAGVQKTFETVGLAKKLRKAIRDEMRRDADRGNPVVRPYPFEWTYDEDGQFDDKYDVLALTTKEMSPRVKSLIMDAEPPPVDRDLDPGSCWQLRVELETHTVPEVKDLIPWAEIFGPAEKAGLMVPPKESKEADDLDDEDEDAEPEHGAPEVGRAAEQGPPAFVVEPGNGVWKGGTLPAFPPKGHEVHLNPPDDVSDQRVNEVRAQFEKAGYTVATVVLCDHCDAQMTTLDLDCPSCGSEYDDDGKLISRPCLNADCTEQVKLEGAGPKYICGKCASIHEIVPDKQGPEAWRLAPRDQAAAPAPAQSARRRKAAAREEAPAAKAAEPPAQAAATSQAPAEQQQGQQAQRRGKKVPF